MAETNDSIKLVKRIDFTLKTLLVVGAVLLLLLLFWSPRLLYLFIFIGVVLCLGFYLPRHIGWKIRQQRAIYAKTTETQKWGFASRDREGPWINYIDYPLVYRCEATVGKQFYSEWLVIENGLIIVNPGPSVVDKANQSVTYDLSVARAYAWDGCTPKRLFFWFALIGTPDWWNKELQVQMINQDGKVCDKHVFWQLAQHASLVHDALYQYLDSIPLAKSSVDQLFYRMLLEAGLPEKLANLYLFAVRKFGAQDVSENSNSPNTPYQCNSFSHLCS